MTFCPDVIVSLWMLPVVVFIVLPLAILVVYSGSRILKKISGTARTVAEPAPGINRQRTKEAV
jgi:hypothetical protein